MSLYQCDKCGVIENTALGRYHSRNVTGIWKDEDMGQALCSECGPKTYKSGEPTEYGEWHGRFEKKFYPVGTMETDEVGNIRAKRTQHAEQVKHSAFCQYGENEACPACSTQDITSEGDKK
jgi:hypothetical protein